MNVLALFLSLVFYHDTLGTVAIPAARDSLWHAPYVSVRIRVVSPTEYGAIQDHRLRLMWALIGALDEYFESERPPLWRWDDLAP